MTAVPDLAREPDILELVDPVLDILVTGEITSLVLSLPAYLSLPPRPFLHIHTVLHSQFTTWKMSTITLCKCSRTPYLCNTC
jgi:hypothetical protein